MSDALSLLLYPLLAALLLTGIHTYLGIHVLTRNVVFVDLALAQVSALGATVAFMRGYLPQSGAAYAYALLFTVAGAAVLALTRSWSGRISQETFIGVVYVVSAAAAFLLIDRAPQGAEHIKQLLVGNILTVSSADLLRLAAVYGAIGLFHLLLARRFLLVSLHPEQAARDGMRVWAWDFAFYVSFGIVVTSSVAIAGVLLVFSFLIIPAAIGILFHPGTLGRLAIGWAAGTVASVFGLGASYWGDLPTGAALVCAFGALLALAGIGKALCAESPQIRTARLSRARRAVWVAGIGIFLASGTWLTVNPLADQPLLDLIEAWQPRVRESFLSADERAVFADAAEAARRVRGEAGRIGEMERKSRWSGQELTDQELRNLYSYLLSFQEMERGEVFVQQELRNRVRSRQRWVLGVPIVAIALGAMLWVWRSGRPKPDRSGAA